MKKIKGYIFSRPFLDERAPQHIQNLVIREFCKKKDYIIVLVLSNTLWKILTKLFCN